MNAFSTIQGGINGVDSGGTVEVLPGTYTETVNVDTTGLTLAGYGSAMPTVTAPTTVSYAPIISVAAADVTVSGLNITVDQPYASAGVAAVSAASGPNVFDGLQVLDNTITSVGTTPWGHGLANPFGSAYSVGIAALANGGGAIPTVTIQGNQVLAGTGGRCRAAARPLCVASGSTRPKAPSAGPPRPLGTTPSAIPRTPLWPSPVALPPFRTTLSIGPA